MSAEPAEPLHGIVVLLVDDDPDVRDSVADLLRISGAEVSTAASVSAAVHALEDRRFNVVLADLSMPGEDGYALLRKVRALAPERRPRTPVIAVTGRDSECGRALESGFDGYLLKSMEPLRLVDAVRLAARR